MLQNRNTNENDVPPYSKMIGRSEASGSNSRLILGSKEKEDYFFDECVRYPKLPIMANKSLFLPSDRT